MKQTIILIFAFILFSSIVIGQPNFVQSSNELTGSLIISVPKNPAFMLGANITEGHIHVYNSTGHYTPTTDVNCTAHIYDKNNQHILETDLVPDSNLVDMVIPLNSTFFDEIGDFPFTISCYTDDESGFFSGVYKITRSGNIYETHTGLVAFVLLSLGLTGLLFMFSSMLNNVGNSEWMQSVKLLVNLIALFILLGGTGFMVRGLYILNYPLSLVNISAIVYFALLFTIVPVIIILLIMFIKQIMEFWDKLRGGEQF